MPVTSRRFVDSSIEGQVYTRHVAVTHGGHCDHRPPEPVWYALEVAQRTAGLGEVDCTAK